MDLLDDDIARWLLIFYYTLSELPRTYIKFLMIFLLISYKRSIQTKQAHLVTRCVLHFVLCSYKFSYLLVNKFPMLYSNKISRVERMDSSFLRLKKGQQSRVYASFFVQEMDKDFLPDQETRGAQQSLLLRRARDAELVKKIIQVHTKLTYINSSIPKQATSDLQFVGKPLQRKLRLQKVVVELI